MTREEWLYRLTERLRPHFEAKSIALPERIAVSCRWPSQNARRGPSQRIGECWRAECSEAERPEIFISPVLADPVEVGHVLSTS